MDLETEQTNATAKLPILKQGEYEMWRLRIEQYFQVQNYALWDVIENGNSFKPTARTTANDDGTSTSMIPGHVTTEEKAQKKNDVKARIQTLQDYFSDDTFRGHSLMSCAMLTLPRDPTPPKDKSKGKGIVTKEPLKEIMPYMEESGSVPKIQSLKSFVIPEGQLTNEDVMAQVKEMKRLADLKAEKEKSKKSLQKILNPATIRAHAQKMCWE
ncbi:hypothetical protein Tco_0058721 [Tanacetum coccineum]